MENLSVGDLVRLKSGGPVMTVSDVDSLAMELGINNVTCDWFLDDTHCRKSFAFATLEKVKA